MSEKKAKKHSIKSEEQGTGWKKVKGWAKEHVCMTCGHGQQCGDGLRELRVWVEVDKREKVGATVIA